MSQSNVTRMLGKQDAVDDRRIARLERLLPVSFAPGKSTNWRAHTPAKGIPILRNNIIGNCVICTAFHYVQTALAYTTSIDIDPTDDEAVGEYSAITGYDPAQTQQDGSNPTDNGTVVAGPGGLLEYWTKTGLVIAGQRNFLKGATRVNHKNLDAVKQALSLGPLMVGAQLTQANVDSNFMWVAGNPYIGGHEFLVLDCEEVAGKTYFDVETWDGMWRYDESFATQSVDEIYMVLDPAFFGPSGLDPADVDMAMLQRSMSALAA
jgi:hypothetical protein